jgi:GDP-fucose transporter C1
LTFLFAQLVLAVLLIRACVLFRLLVLPPFDIQLCKTISGVIVVNVVGLVFNTLCLKLVDASYFQVRRPSSPSLPIPGLVVASSGDTPGNETDASTSARPSRSRAASFCP